MDFEIEITAKTTDEGGLVASFDRQLAMFGGEALLLKEVKPYKVESSGAMWFEARRTYKITL